ncbi:cytidylyltransferase domain-containing protein [Halobaculum limi]|uniref:acylneuraminate cytidylyltransferase family protein n=1 Tax=Halobaculum limi TaxID=3031916 RepID=UPI002406D7F4|nr:acylneuraminate cytidylyltransferase family protein [Halobaculum sp. YSMS11]
MTSVLAIIPARGGSKRVKRKNIREVGGKPLIAHTIEEAISTEAIDTTIVSTEDDEIAEIAKKYGADVPFSRPEELATDSASSASVVSHALDWFEARDKTFDTVCLLQATSPLRTSEDITGALSKFNERDADSLLSVCKYTQPPQYALLKNSDGYLQERFTPSVLFSPEYTREQDLEELLFPNGAIYIVTVSTWKSVETFYTEATIPYVMPERRSLQIDELWELELIDSFMKADR